jgi:hypothetical protein
MRLSAPVIALLLLSACNRSQAVDGSRPSADDAHGYVPPAVRPPHPIAGQERITPLTAYIGKSPHDAVEGVEFYDRTDIATALVITIRDPAVRQYFHEVRGQDAPIFARDGRIGAWGCAPDRCTDRNWTFLVDTKSVLGTACYHDQATMGASSHWYSGEMPVTRPGGCPSS